MKRRLISILLVVAIMLAITTTSFSQSAQPLGDANRDGIINTADAVTLLRICSGQLECKPEDEKYADANNDKIINTADAVYVLKIAAGMAEILYLDESEYYTVTYSMGELLTAAPPAVEVKAGEVFTVSPVSYNSTFLGWVSDYNGELYAPNSTFVMPACNVTLMAAWQGQPLPTITPTASPTATPTATPSSSPTATPSSSPTPPLSGEVQISYYDSLNQLSVGGETISVEGTITSASLNIPEGFMLENPEMSLPISEKVTVNVYPYELIEDEVFRIVKNNDGFNNIRNNLSANYTLATDLDLLGKNFVPFGWANAQPNAETTAFTGKFDGKGHTISDLYIDYHGSSSNATYKNVALFAINEGVIRNLVIYSNMPDSTSDSYFGIFGDRNCGAVCGTNSGLISGCRVYGYLGTLDMYTNSGGKCGGICGVNNQNGTVEKCSFEGALDGFYWVGGLVGMNYGTLTQSYFAGSINATTSDSTLQNYNICCVGGLCGGQQNSTITDCYVVVTGYICAWTKCGGMIGWYDKGVIKNCFINDPAIYGHESLGYVTGYLPGGDSSMPSTETGLYMYFSNPADCNGGGMYPEYSTSIWDLNASFLAHIPDLIDCRRGNSWFNAYGV